MMAKNVSDGCLYHVCMPIKPNLILAANTNKMYKLLSKTAKGGPHFEANAQAEMEESAKVDAATKEIEELLKIALCPLLQAQKIPDLISEDTHLELRLLLCKTESVAVQ